MSLFLQTCICPSHLVEFLFCRSRKDERYGFQDCYQKSVEFLGDIVDKPEEIQRREIYALSYYSDRALDLGIIGMCILNYREN